jgi:phage terminase large subunit
VILDIPTAPVFEPLLAPARYKGAKGGRGSGKSHFFADCWLEEQVRTRIDFVCLREVQKDLKFSVKKLLESKIEGYNAGYYFDVQDRQILSRHGGVTIFEGMQNHTADSIKSLEKFKRAWFEEAHRASQRSLDLLRPTIRDEDSELWFSWNPENDTDPVDQLLLGAEPPPRCVVVHATFDDNPWLPKVLREELEHDRKRDPTKFRHIWLGEYQSHSEARVFKNWRTEEFDVDLDAVKRQGADWGYAIDPTVLVQCYIVGRTLYVPFEAWMIGCDIVDIPELFMTVPEAEKWPVTADSARPETIAHLRKNGFPKVLPAVKGAKSLEEGVAFLQSFDIVVHPRCQHVIDELTMYRYRTDPLTGKVLPVLEDKNNHCIDALRYACEGVRRARREKEREVPAAEKEVAERSISGGTAWMA